MHDHSEPGSRLFAAPSNYIFGRNPDDRERLRYQFGLLREDFNLWFDEALRRCGLSTDSDRANWAVLDVGCGEGQTTYEIARRYPHAHMTGVDVDAAAIKVASASVAPGANLRFLAHDVRHPIPCEIVPAGGFDVVVTWLLLLYMPDKRGTLAHLAAALAPGGALLLGDVPDVPIFLDDPAAKAITTVGRTARQRIGMTGLEQELGPLLRQTGFTEVTTVTLRYPVGGATCHGQRWFAHALDSFRAGRHLVVDRLGLMRGEEFDMNLERLMTESALDHSGETRFLVTLARRG